MDKPMTDSLLFHSWRNLINEWIYLKSGTVCQYLVPGVCSHCFLTKKKKKEITPLTKLKNRFIDLHNQSTKKNTLKFSSSNISRSVTWSFIWSFSISSKHYQCWLYQQNSFLSIVFECFRKQRQFFVEHSLHPCRMLLLNKYKKNSI